MLLYVGKSLDLDKDFKAVCYFLNFLTSNL